MKKAVPVLLLLVFLSACAARKPLDQPVTIPDPGLAAAIAEATGLAPGQFNTTALNRLTRLNASNRGIQDLTGMQYCTRLVELDLSHNQITDLGPLAGLIGLAVLDLSDNKVSDLAPLSRMVLLTSIVLSNNQITDLEPLVQNCAAGGIPVMTWIHLEHNPLNEKAFEVDIPYLVAEGATVVVTEDQAEITRRPPPRITSKHNPPLPMNP